MNYKVLIIKYNKLNLHITRKPIKFQINKPKKKNIKSQFFSETSQINESIHLHKFSSHYWH